MPAILNSTYLLLPETVAEKKTSQLTLTNVTVLLGIGIICAVGVYSRVYRSDSELKTDFFGIDLKKFPVGSENSEIQDVPAVKVNETDHQISKKWVEEKRNEMKKKFALEKSTRNSRRATSVSCSASSSTGKSNSGSSGSASGKQSSCACSSSSAADGSSSSSCSST